MKILNLTLSGAALSVFLYACASHPEAPGLFSAADSNRDGYVSQNEWQQTGGNDVAFMAADRSHRGKLNEAEFYEAVRLNQQSKGNTEVQQRMNDVQLARSIKDALSTARDVNGYAIRVDVYNGVATLSGTVRSQAEKQKAEDIANGVQGVNQVFNSITIKY